MYTWAQLCVVLWVHRLTWQLGAPPLQTLKLPPTSRPRPFPQFMGYTLTPEPSIVTEFMARGSLFHILRQAGNRPPELRLQRAVALSVARGMAYLHSRAPPILHLDLKSPNVLVDDRWRIKIAGAGLESTTSPNCLVRGLPASVLHDPHPANRGPCSQTHILLDPNCS